MLRNVDGPLQPTAKQLLCATWYVELRPALSSLLSAPTSWVLLDHQVVVAAALSLKSLLIRQTVNL